ncbi:uncharacterized protein EDB91DRAFT_1240120 [Suillus paluster]|uniref:uncharacterized protein n=1 Tax=Suillus paluster TaxID=48578 RepID=UPI001B86473B|nr:uncharacterized protein EDB91DRAFT_1240120 [Suillus paluster]KAG1723246.1 hypothetical protein EDB91DRAFT_1240120 [Suillus paluster]
MDRNDENDGQPARIQQQRSSVPSFLFLIFMLFILTNHTGDEFLARNHYQDALQSLNYQLSNFTAWLNGTESNFTMPDRKAATTPLVGSFMSFGSHLNPQWASYFPNVTGFAHGEIDFFNITTPSLASTAFPWRAHAETFMGDTNMTELVSHVGSWNWTGSDKISWSIMDRTPVGVKGVTEKIAIVHGRIDVRHPTSSDDMKLDFEGVHFLANGTIYGFAEPTGRHIDIRYIPAIVPEAFQNDTARTIEPELISRVNKVKDLIDAGVIDQESTNGESQGGCGFSVYAQIAPSEISVKDMEDLEDELQKPTGRWTVKRPPLKLNGVLLSRECGILYKLHDTEGLSLLIRVFCSDAGISAFVYLAQLLLLSRQVDRSRTPAGLSRVSLWTFLTQSIVDSVSFAGHITFAIIASGRPSLSLVAPAFVACVLFAFESQHAILINQVQAPEDAVAPSPPRPVQQEPSVPSQVVPTPPTAPPRSTGPTFFSLLLRHIRSDPQARIWLGMFFFLTFIVRVIVTPSLALVFVATMYSLFWLPQIVRSVKKGRSSALTAEYLIGTSLCRLFHALYFLTCPKNVLDIEPRRWMWYLAMFIFLQVAVILLQQRLGPAFFLPKRFAHAQVYDYHPALPLSAADPEAPDESLGDCAICMEAIHTDDEKQLEQVTGGRSYSLAPCQHLFHTECLEKWLAIKNICPHCRRPLPPL